MTTAIVILCILAALLELDTTYVGQLSFSRPIIAGPVFGLITGDIMAGIQVGVFTELLFADISPLGGIIPPSGVMCAAIPMILYSLGIELYFGFFLGVIAGIAYGQLDKWMRKARFKWMVFLEKNATARPGAFFRTVIMLIVSAFLLNLIFISVCAWICTQLMYNIVAYIPLKMYAAFKFAYMAVPWIGLATLIPAFRLKTR